MFMLQSFIQAGVKSDHIKIKHVCKQGEYLYIPCGQVLYSWFIKMLM